VRARGGVDMGDVGVSETNRPSKTHDAARRRRDGGVREDERDENARNALGARSVRARCAMRARCASRGMRMLKLVTHTA
jgi:hypothetical protein